MKNSKKYITLKFSQLICTASLLIGIYSCELERLPESNLSDATFWQKENDFKQAANYLYSASHRDFGDDYYELYQDNMSDNAIGLAFNPVSNGTYLPTGNGNVLFDQFYQIWRDNYALIRASNKILEQADIADVDKTGLTTSLSEAMFFRAYGYFDLVKRYGDVPLILQTLDINDNELFSERTDRATIIDQIYADLDYAIENLPLKSEGVDYGRISKGTALGLKSRIALYEGTRIKYHGASGNDRDFSYHLNLARQASLEVINSGEFQLFTAFGEMSYDLLFKGEGEGPDNPETMWAFIYGFNMENSVNIINTAQQISNGEMAATRSLVDAYLATDGLPIEQSPLYQGQLDASSEFVDRDPRLDATIVKTGDLYFLEDVEYTPQLRALTGYHVEKFFEIENLRHLDLMIMRYAEILLNYAEATYELSESISDADLNISLNQLRSRAFMPDLTNAFVASNNLDMREEIRRERRVELALEGFRYDDLIRWKIAENVLPGAIKGVYFFDDEYTTVSRSDLTIDPEGFIIVEPESNRTFDPSKNYLWPLPLNELSLNPNLGQNPNWN